MRLLFIFLLLFTQYSFSKKIKKPLILRSQQLQINRLKWISFKVRKLPNSDRYAATLEGRTSPKMIIKVIGEDVIFFSNSNEFKTEKTSEVFEQPVVFSDQTGNFELNLVLPRLNSQISFEFENVDGDKKTHQFNLSMDNDFSDLMVKPVLTVDLAIEKIWNFSVATGPAQIKILQTATIPSNLGINSLSYKNLFLELSKKTSEKFKVISNLHYLSGELAPNSSVLISNSHYQWVNLNLNLNYSKWNLKANEKLLSAGLVTGFQYTQYPFFNRSSAVTPNFVSIDSKSIVSAALGFDFNLKFNSQWALTSDARYLYPVLSSGTKISARPSFDVLLGLNYQFSPKAKLGLYGFYQSLNFSFYDLDDMYFVNNAGPKINGTNQFSISSLNLRFGIDFD